MTEQATLYERLGGKDAVNAAVEIFYKKVLADDRINSFFANIDMEKQRRKQKVFMTYAFGGAPNYSGKAMRAAHTKIVEEQGLNDDHFNAVAENLKSALEELNVPAELITEVLTTVDSTRDEVLNR